MIKLYNIVIKCNKKKYPASLIVSPSNLKIVYINEHGTALETKKGTN